MNKACYRKLKRYKYQLVEPYKIDIGIKGYAVDTLQASLHFRLRSSSYDGTSRRDKTPDKSGKPKDFRSGFVKGLRQYTTTSSFRP
jgi:hypothetical protein